MVRRSARLAKGKNITSGSNDDSSASSSPSLSQKAPARRRKVKKNAAAPRKSVAKKKNEPPLEEEEKLQESSSSSQEQKEEIERKEGIQQVHLVKTPEQPKVNNAPAPSSPDRADVRVLCVKVGKRLERLEFDFSSNTVREDVLLGIRSLLGASLNPRERGAPFFLQDELGQIHVLSKWFLARCAPKDKRYASAETLAPHFGALRVRTKPLEGFRKSSRNYWLLFGGVILLERLFGNPFPISRIVPHLDYPSAAKLQEGMSGFSGALVTILYLGGWIVASAMTSRITSLLFLAKVFGPKVQASLINSRIRYEKDVIRKQTIVRNEWKRFLDRLCGKLAINSSDVSAGLGAVRVCMLFAFPVIAGLAIVSAELGASSSLFLVIVFLATSAVFAVAGGNALSEQIRATRSLETEEGANVDISFSVKAVGARQSLIKILIEGPGATPHCKVELAQGDGEFMETNEVSMNWKFEETQRRRQEKILFVSSSFILVFAMALRSDFSATLTMIWLVFAGAFFLFPEKARPLRDGVSRIMGLKPETNYSLRLWVTNHRGQELVASESMQFATLQDISANQTSFIFEDGKVFRSALVCWGQLAPNKPPSAIRVEPAETDSFMDCLRAAFLDDQFRNRPEEGPDALLSFPQQASQHLVLSRVVLSRLQRQTKALTGEKVIRIHAPGTTVPSYKLKTDIWNSVKIRNSHIPSQVFLFGFAIVFVLTGFVTISIVKLYVLIDMILFGNTALLFIHAIKFWDMSRRYLAVALLAIFAAVWLDLRVFSG